MSILRFFGKRTEVGDTPNNSKNSESSKSSKSSAESSSRLLVNLGITVDKAIEDWISNPLDDPLDRERLEKKLEDLGRGEIETCKRVLEAKLREDVLRLLFGNNLKEVEKENFRFSTLTDYPKRYLWDTDYGNFLCGENIMVGNIGESESGSKRILLKVESRVDRSIQDGMFVSIPFDEQFSRGSDKYKINVNDVGIQYLGSKKKTKQVVKLVNFVQKIEMFLKQREDRKFY